MIIQSIVNIAEICARLNVRHAVISPGSRSAPITLAFARHPEIKCYVIPDERSAGFIAMGIAQSTNSTVAVICTSGTAVLNLSPSIAEAYYQKIPLIILTADRPPEWIDKADGQTIRQNEVFRNIIKKSYVTPTTEHGSESDLKSNQIISEALQTAQSFPRGPVHVNIPIREPFYPKKNEVFLADENISINRQSEPKSSMSEKQWEDIESKLNQYPKILMVFGQYQSQGSEVLLIQNAIRSQSVTVFAEITSNLMGSEHIIHYSDHLLFDSNIYSDNELQPELLITFGGPLISKKLKQFLRKGYVKEHWHVSEDGVGPDTFQSLTKIVSSSATDFLENSISYKALTKMAERNTYLARWKKIYTTALKCFEKYVNSAPFGDLIAIKSVLDRLPDSSMLHLGNSMPVRYANMIGLPSSTCSINVFANRGTSGIDGSLSTVVGHAMVNTQLQVLLIGDMAFFYDINALWNKYLNNNLRIIILNNGGGGIFRLIPGPNRQPELEEYFELKHRRQAKWIAKDFNLEYKVCDNDNELGSLLAGFFDISDRPKMLEITTDGAINQEIYMKLISYFNE